MSKEAVTLEPQEESQEAVTLESLALTISKQFEAIGQQFEAMNRRFDAIEQRVNRIGKRLDLIETTQLEIGRKLDQLLDGGVDMSARHVESDDRMASRLYSLEQAFLKHLAEV